MKKYFIFGLLAIILGSQLIFAKSLTSTKMKPNYNACVNSKIKQLTKEMTKKKQDAWTEFKTANKKATTSQARREIEKNYNQKIVDIKRWYNQELKNVKTECKSLQSSTSTLTTTTSSQQ
ncbi:MAG: hypothetical protein KatS3mg097_627 [Candidatus Parcubacteria bacterium]|nr:MAG: hypothetical protein KatS3mg097_627 [Candidatus Parcubacteria bacterium]